MLVKKYDYKQSGMFTLKHEALVESVTGMIDMHELAIRCGYHPAGYGLYKEQVSRVSGDVYKVTWESATSCD